MQLGFYARLANDLQPDDLFKNIFRHISPNERYWQVNQSFGYLEIYDEEYCRSIHLVPVENGKIYTDAYFHILMSQEQYFESIILYRWPEETGHKAIRSFQDYLNSNCDLVLLCYDSCEIEIYAKDASELDALKLFIHTLSLEDYEDIEECNAFRQEFIV